MFKKQKIDVGLFSILMLAFVASFGFACSLTNDDDKVDHPQVHEQQRIVALFDGAPTAPQNLVNHPEYANYDVQVHSRDVNTWDTLEGINAQHGGSCEGPPSTHFNNSYEGSVFICNNHLMTAINASGYGLIYVTPNKMVNFCGAPGVVQFEMSTEIMSKRDWPDVWISPWNDALAAPFNSGEVDLQGNPRTTMHMHLNNSEYAPVAHVLKNNVTLAAIPGWQATPLNNGVTAVNKAATRQTFRITVTRTSFKFERLASNTASALTYFNITHADVGFCEGVVQFGQHSYTPTKDNAGVPATWHWDEIQIAPFTPFQIIHANKRFVDARSQYGTDKTVTFDSPAPDNAFVRFTAIGKVRVDGVLVNPVIPTWKYEHFNSYFVPIASGKQTITLSFEQDNWYTGPFRAKDFAIWSKTTGPLPTPTNTVTPQPTNTATITPTKTATAPPASTATNTPAPPIATNTPVAPTATPQLGLCINSINQGNNTWYDIKNSDVLEVWWLSPTGQWTIKSTSPLPDQYQSTLEGCN